MTTRISTPRFPGSRVAERHASAAWGPFSLRIVGHKRHVQKAFKKYVVAVHLTGRHRVWVKFHDQLIEGWSDPGTVSIVPANLKVTWETTSTWRVALLEIPEAELFRIILEKWKVPPSELEIQPQFLVRDSVIESLIGFLANEACGGPGDVSSYGRQICAFLTCHIVHAYSSLSVPPASAKRRLSGTRLDLVLEHIDQNLARRLTLRELISLAGTSARQFQRLFRQAVGAPPHVYVTTRRVAAARELLINEPTLSVSEIAARVGFSSRSHLASAFRRWTGQSPAAFRHCPTSN